eukprot:1294101-Prymnesium_polylepis.2
MGGTQRCAGRGSQPAGEAGGKQRALERDGDAFSSAYGTLFVSFASIIIGERDRRRVTHAARATGRRRPPRQRRRCVARQPGTKSQLPRADRA